MIAVVKIGTSSLTDEHGEIDLHAIEKLCAEVAGLRGQGHKVVVVTSGAIAAGLLFIFGVPWRRIQEYLVRVVQPSATERRAQ